MHALILSFSPIASDARVRRQIRSLASRARVFAAGFGEPPTTETCDFVRLQDPRRGPLRTFGKAALLALRRFDEFYRRSSFVKEAFQKLGERRFDLVVANDVLALPAALDIARGAPVLLDAHEFMPGEFEDRLAWRLLYQPYAEDLCRRYLHKASAMTTVADAIASAYERDFGVRAQVVYSAPPLADLAPSATSEGAIRLIHHGAAIPSRHLETMIDLVNLLDHRFTLDFMLVPTNAAYAARLKKRVAGNTRIRFREPVPVERIVQVCNAYDVGVFLLPPVSFNYQHALPNKFFEFVQARLAVAIGPSPEMRALADRHRFGIVAEDFEPRTLAAKLNALTAHDVEQLKQNAHLAAKELCYERAEEVFLAAVEKAMKARACAA